MEEDRFGEDAAVDGDEHEQDSSSDDDRLPCPADWVSAVAERELLMELPQRDARTGVATGM